MEHSFRLLLMKIKNYGCSKLEMAKEQLSMRLLCSEARIDSSSVRSGFFSDDDWSKLTDAADILSEAPIYLDDSSELTSLDVKTKARRLKMEKNIGLILAGNIPLVGFHDFLTVFLSGNKALIKLSSNDNL